MDTPFGECSEEECTVLLDDDKIELQRVTINVPAGSDVTGALLLASRGWRHALLAACATPKLEGYWTGRGP